MNLSTKKQKKTINKTTGQKNKNLDFVFILSRYIFVLLLTYNNLFIFYYIFTPLTVYPVYFLLKLFFNPVLSGTTILLNNRSIQIAKACVAGSAYFLLTLLNFSMSMPVKKRIFSLFFSYFLLLFINIFRIFIFSILFINIFSLFHLLHLIVWYFLSGVIVFLVWFVEIKIFNIKEIPFYNDMKLILSAINNKKISKENKKKK